MYLLVNDIELNEKELSTSLKFKIRPNLFICLFLSM